MRLNREVYCYQHRQFIIKTPSVKGAANIANTSTTTVNKIIKGTLEVTADGWVFTTEPLSPDEMEHMPDSNKIYSKPNLTRIGKNCYKQVKKQMYDVPCKTGLVTHIPRTREERLKMLKQFITTKLRTRWMLIPEKVATLEQQMLTELLDSLK